MSQGVLGHKVAAPVDYAPEVLFPLQRAAGRGALALPAPLAGAGGLPFFGSDGWTAYELAWRNLAGVPQLAVAQLALPITSPNLVESKSLKLYLGSLYRRRFADPEEVVALIGADVAACIGAPIEVTLVLPEAFAGALENLPGTCIDDLPLVFTEEEAAPNAAHLVAQAQAPAARQRLTTRLLRSLCPVTGQPDWADLQVTLTGAAVEPAGLLRYVVGFSGHTGFHEQCVEQIFCDLQARLNPASLSVYARYTRRGGIDINPFRTSSPTEVAPQLRCYRQ